MNNKILFLLHFPPPVHGAAMVGKYIKDSSEINDSFATRYINLGTSRSIDDIGKGGVRKITRFIGLLWEVAVQMMIFRPDKVYLTLTAKGSGFYKDAVVVFIAKMLGGQMIYHFHNKGVQTRQDKLFDHWLYKKVFNNTDVILLSEHLYSDVEKYLSHKRVYICPNGIEKINLNHKYKHNGRVEILFLSNILKSKGVFDLLDALVKLRSKNLDFDCIFVGEWGNIIKKDFDKKVREHELNNYVEYAGSRYGNCKKRYLTNADIFCLPSHSECFPLVLLEAMSAELPIVSTYNGGIPDIVKNGKNGFLIKPKDKNALADKLEILIKNSQLRKKMGITGGEIFESNFTLTHFEERLTSILKTILLKNSSNQP